MTERARTILDLARDDLEPLLERIGQPRYRADQLLAWIHRRGVLEPAEMTNLPRALRLALADALPRETGYAVGSVETSTDGTTRLDLALADGAVTETVLIPEDDDADVEEGVEAEADVAPPAVRPRARRRGPDRAAAGLEDPSSGNASTILYTQCLSTQVGCAFRCAFCRSGTLGFVRQLAAGEILAQRHAARREIAGRGAIVRTVLMGIGEPLHNAAEVIRALRLLTDSKAGAVSPRRVTVSTIGLPEGIRALGEAFGGKIGLAWSLHAADEETRALLLPVAARRPVSEVLAALHDYPLPPRRRITVECVLVGGINDSDRHARAVVRLLAGLRCKVNLIPFNPWVDARAPAADAAHGGSGSGAPPARLIPPAPGRVDAFRQVLVDAGLSAFVRRPRGADILAACGQLLGAADLSRAGRWDS